MIDTKILKQLADAATTAANAYERYVDNHLEEARFMKDAYEAKKKAYNVMEERAAAMGDTRRKPT